MRVEILCSDVAHPIWPLLNAWCRKCSKKIDAVLHNKSDKLEGGDVLFLISCTEYIPKTVRDKYKHAFVLHASDLPEGRGWSPHIWEILNGAVSLVVSVVEAADSIDVGDIWAKKRISVPDHALSDEINNLLFAAELELMDEALELLGKNHTPVPQTSSNATYFRKRTPEDSRIDPERSIAEQFESLRVADPDRYPAYFYLRGRKYKIQLSKVDSDD